MRRFRPLALASLALFGAHAAAVWLALNPNVGADYRAYFIERSTGCWPRPVSGSYRLGRTLSFVGADAPVEAFIVCGWLPPFSEGMWSTGDQARLAFAFPAPQAGYVIDITAFGFIADALPAQRVRVWVNGQPLPDLVLAQGTQGRNRINVPAEVAIGNAHGMVLRLDFPDAASPKDLGLGSDPRPLGLLLTQLTIRPRT